MEDLIPIDIYKDPLKKNEEGFGYLGCILQNKTEEKIQCHVCGGLYEYLATHIKKHKLSILEYKERFQLSRKTSLISRSAREKRMAIYLRHPKEDRERWAKAGRERFKKLEKEGKVPHTGLKISLEEQNKRGSCPDQILEEIKRYYETYKQVPSQRQFAKSGPLGQRYLTLACKRFGSWNKALIACGFPPNKAMGAKLGSKVTDYETETLLELINNFALDHKRIPRYSDFIQGELPHYSVYYQRFGSLEKARQASGVYDLF